MSPTLNSLQKSSFIKLIIIIHFTLSPLFRSVTRVKRLFYIFVLSVTMMLSRLAKERQKQQNSDWNWEHSQQSSQQKGCCVMLCRFSTAQNISKTSKWQKKWKFAIVEPTKSSDCSSSCQWISLSLLYNSINFPMITYLVATQRENENN